jgi:catechol 2,3-dioxygenase-like lactoylglutathione lyase family enzyme
VIVETPPSITGVHETVVYGSELAALTAFYEDALRLRRVSTMGDLGVALRLADGGVLLLFDPAKASGPGRDVPSHGATGPGHVAFTIPAGSYDVWLGTLRRRGVEIEDEIAWERGGRSIYVRDPAGNSVELVDGPIWRE